MVAASVALLLVLGVLLVIAAVWGFRVARRQRRHSWVVRRYLLARYGTVVRRVGGGSRHRAST